ncbi:ABC-type Co2+ transport system permease subunit [Micromonospora luteifusca]|uniref:ABC-type Co2+ transport system permease subunit n=1 Tax=Micromonospora luteifusca TaxID=709860 RepID=A0ABS2LTW7_9ACTN|nr:hypothetical protein [Micromonospora luteifusca]MBM7491627.1 ABC-type Co2+ transport system permease subunit [Micromonospora luteifusca]
MADPIIPNVVVVFYIVSLALTAVVLLGVAITSFATTSRVDRVLAGIGGALAGYYVYYLLSSNDETVAIFYGALLLPFYAGRKLYLGFRDRDRARAERAAAKEAIQAAEEWRSARRW